MDILAFLPAAVAALVSTKEKPAVPEFKPRWWYRRDRLDARPVIWSLDNRPEEWEGRDQYGQLLSWRSTLGYVIHKPSQHKFHVYHDSYARLESAPGVERVQCGCTSYAGRLQRFHSPALKHAANRWFCKQFPDPVIDHDHFKGHFVRRESDNG